MDLRFTPEELAFRDEVRAFFRATLPAGIRDKLAAGKHLGTIRAPKPVHNFAWGGADGKTLYLTARSTLYRLPLLVAGVRP